MERETTVTAFNRPGMARTRALLKAMGYDGEDLRRPRIGVANSWSETSPGHSHLRGVAEAVKAGVWQAGGTPFEFGGFGQCPMDVGRSGMRYDTPTRDVIAAEVETCAQIHSFDGLVLISSCDKNGPGHLLAAARLNLPAILVPGGPMLPGRHQGKDVIITDLDAETWACGVGRPRLSSEALAELEDAVCPGAGSCALLGTANTMQCLAEAAGLALPGSATAPAVSAQRLWFAKQAGRRIVGLVQEDLRPNRILTRDALENMIRVLHAIGGSTNAVLHILALAQELDLGGEVTLETIAKLSSEVDCIVNVRPSGTYTMADFDEAGGVPAVMRVLGDRLNRGCLTVTGGALDDSLRAAAVRRSEVIRPVDQPVFRGGLVILRGSLATSAVVRPSVVPQEMMTHTGPARTFDSLEDCLQGLEMGRVCAGEVIVLRYEGPRGGPGLTEVFKVLGYMGALGLDRSCALVTDGKISGFAKGPFICQVSPEAALGGPIALVRDGDEIEVDIPRQRLNLLVPAEVLEARRRAWSCPRPRVDRGFLSLYARLAEPAERGAGLPVRWS
ncbi:MAG TPA: dihydroxy-acid dehydratase [Candidatus Methylomirabilis sp.]|nr:dihydroxy-acid dehydratase [Candidatus Methylomirabilis sp.]